MSLLQLHDSPLKSFRSQYLPCNPRHKERSGRRTSLPDPSRLDPTSILATSSTMEDVYFFNERPGKPLRWCHLCLTGMTLTFVDLGESLANLDGPYTSCPLGCLCYLLPDTYAKSAAVPS